VFHVKQLQATTEVVLRVMAGEASFEEGLAAVVAYQRRFNGPLAAYWQRRGFTTEQPTAGEVPAVMTDLFRSVRLTSSEAEPTMVFRTSGTTSGARGEHWRLSTEAYDAGAARHFAALVLPGGGKRRFVKWCFDPAEVGDSSLSHMVADLERRFGTGCGPWQLGAEGLRAEALTELTTLREPVVVFTTAFALSWLLERFEAPVALPAGSLLIETGGFKGKSREIPRDELYASAQAALGLPAEAMLSEYSMTELSSQLYSRQVVDGAAGPTQRLLVPPAWCRVLAIDPAKGQPVAEGEEGLLRFIDLANVETVVAVQTADRGRVTPAGVELLGRAPGAVARGCGLSVEELRERGDL
jgi:hypothetical protein